MAKRFSPHISHLGGGDGGLQTPTLERDACMKTGKEEEDEEKKQRKKRAKKYKIITSHRCPICTMYVFKRYCYYLAHMLAQAS